VRTQYILLVIIFHCTHETNKAAVAMKMFRFKNVNSGSILLWCSLLLLAASSMHVTRAQEDGLEDEETVFRSSIVVENKDAFSSKDVTSNDAEDLDSKDSNFNATTTTTHYIRGSSSSGIIDFERELQRAVRCVGRGATCLRTNDCCDPLSCRSNTCQVRKEILKLASSIAILLSFFLNV
jgi:hypothetical protein